MKLKTIKDNRTK